MEGRIEREGKDKGREEETGRGRQRGREEKEKDVRKIERKEES